MTCAATMEPREIVVISGKGGTGKTSVTAAFAAMARRPVVADCDVDAADLHLVLGPETRERHDFRAGHTAVIQPDGCNDCGWCAELCRFGAIGLLRDSTGGVRHVVDPVACEGCGVCVHFCPSAAIDFPEQSCGEWMVSDTRFGPMVHARLAAAAENSGKLVSTVRREARRIAERDGCPVVIVDGPPGIGCPVIASVTGASLVLVVTEPTVSGEHDLRRVLALTRGFAIPTAVCVNKWDLNPDMAARIEEHARRSGATVAGRIRYDHGMTRAQVRELTVTETDSPCARDIRVVWDNIQQ